MRMTVSFNPNSMCYWWPRVKDVNVPKPKTVLVEHGAEVGRDLVGALEGTVPMGKVRKPLHAVYSAAKPFGRPVFVRGDQMAAKHEWKYTCYIAEADEPTFRKHLLKLVEEHELRLWLEGTPLLAFAVREFLNTKPAFKAFYGDMPITRERRLFYVKGEGVVCNHPYWPAGAISEWHGRFRAPQLPREWPLKLHQMNRQGNNSKEHTEEMAERIGKALATAEHPAWSIDLLMDAEYRWWFTDCAVAERSFHWPGCPEAVKRRWPQ